MSQGFVAIIRPYLEATYFLAQIFLSASLIIAILQLDVLKRDIKIRNERAANEKAIDAATNYLTNYVSLSKTFFQYTLDKKCISYSGEIGDFTRDSLELSKDFKTRAFAPGALESTNLLESISATFVTGVADEATGFNIIGKTFCSTVESLYDIISFARRERDGQLYYENIVQLYKIWRPRLTLADLQNARASLDSKIADVPGQTSVKPIGC